MAAFEFVALDPKGKQKKGVLEGDTARQIRQQLREKSLTPLEVNHVGDSVSRKEKGGGFFGPKISVSDLALITRQLATLVKAALPIEEALKAVADQTDKSKVKTIILGVRSKVMEGHTLADGLSDFPSVFNELYRSMVAAGERAGHLDKVLNRLADYTERRQKISSKVSAAMVYPIVLILVAIGVVAGLMVFAVPKVVEQFQNMGEELPTITKVLIGISDFTISYGLYVLVLLILGFIGAKMWLRKEENKLKWHRVILRMPVIGRLSSNLNTAQFSSTLNILHSSGVPLLEAMNIGGKVLSNLKMRKAIQEAAVKVREGGSLKMALQQTGQFPPMMIHMIGSGEASGELEHMLEQVSDNQEGLFENSIDVALNIMGPLIILGLGAMVMFIVAAMMLPIFQLTNSITG
ncbi:type II secretion system inner membrane protein GspF [Kangiella sediminilitoris]|uniref:General secretion pathway protein F n=1 Tax=Kangiella sediminilitoris TaxID=1144748 RepID=A0A1B3B8C8_9GAMM|nr:type II secretion system inner membrane protein GspF [Kangiella sediminilitoris]AOE49021.1 general secretion pathway protein F [Kangiella sediminilitoris]